MEIERAGDRQAAVSYRSAFEGTLQALKPGSINCIFIAKFFLLSVDINIS